MDLTERVRVKLRTTLVLVVVVGVLTTALVVAGCTSTDSTNPASLEGTWQLESFGGAQGLKPADPAVTTNMTMEAGMAGGSGGVNSYSAIYETLGENALTFGRVVATQMAGEQAAMAQEAAFFAALEKTEHFEISDGKLVLSDAGNNTLAVMKLQ